ncbi:HNH endonuclease [Frateuria aurantia]|uniref:HNH nuclease domain-containing protein n=1 Tax=Frateuria aurantia (strain ATCC 33424 / DSM 6220 / KCTC 2777 / LMG 1558 / NBRC 3245 / NCIMB 13370) TaxID=767434 RepID=H8L2B7_FRAAD|nr:HNH endonuclease [Frateuria aurantia]AFC84751.1 hypothetical protein Fraau_0257 [Frateuria aurantia DSM 6220]
MEQWSHAELDAAVESYLWMLEQQAQARPFVKMEIYRQLQARFGRTEKAWEYRMQNISAVLADLGEATVSGLLPAQNVGSRTAKKLRDLLHIHRQEVPPQRYKYGVKRTWEIILSAVHDLGGEATVSQVRDQLRNDYPEFNASNIGADLALLTVNSFSRTSFRPNQTPRTTDTDSAYDRLYKSGHGAAAVYQLYQPEIHGVWEIFSDVEGRSKSGFSVRLINAPAQHGLARSESEVAALDDFVVESVVDGRNRIYASIVRRRGQPTFRKDLLTAYAGRCAISGCDVTEVLEAAHIHPYRGEDTNVVANGLLLRADIHTLFDLYLLSIDPSTLRVRVSPQLQATSYAELEDKPLVAPAEGAAALSRSAIEWHRKQCAW